MILNKINYKKAIMLFLIIIIICFFKIIYIKDLANINFTKLVHYFLVFWGNNNFVNLIWLLPILMNLLFVSKKFYLKLMKFDTRYKNRNKFVLNTIKDCLLYSGAFNFFLIITQVAIITFLIKSNISFSIELIKFIFSYILENTFLNFLIIFLALIIRNYIYSLLMVIILCIIMLTIIPNNIYMPFVSLYCTSDINYMTILLLIGLIWRRH